MQITSDQLRKIEPQISAVKANVIADLLNRLSIEYDLTDPVAYKMFLANVIQESAAFSHKSENMNYTTANRIQAIWPSRFPTVQSALPFVRKPQELANKVYGGRMGNTGSNDGWLYRGAGFIGLTGKEMYTKYAAHLDKPVEEMASLIRTTDEFALDSAFWFFCVLKKLIPVATSGKKEAFKNVCKGINGGTIGYDVRLKYYNKINEILP